MTPVEQARQQRERLAALKRDYANTFSGRVEFDVRRGTLLRIAIVCLFSKREVYRLTFCGAGDRPHPPGQAVLEDLKRVAGINAGGIVVSPVTRTVDSHASIYRAGMRDAYLRIVRFLQLEI